MDEPKGDLSTNSRESQLSRKDEILETFSCHQNKKQNVRTISNTVSSEVGDTEASHVNTSNEIPTNHYHSLYPSYYYYPLYQQMYPYGTSTQRESTTSVNPTSVNPLPTASSMNIPNSKALLVEKWLRRPARRQADKALLSCRTENSNEYNIWYGKYLTDRYDKTFGNDREVAGTKCCPEKDVGYTKAETHPTESEHYICYYFARGCCVHGKECRYRHIIPTYEDEVSLDVSRDIFGRERHGAHKDDMSGVGSFNHECKTLFIGGLRADPIEVNGLVKLEEYVRKEFGEWGDIKELRVIPKKNIAFLTYHHRVQAEFAKVAMADQYAGKHGSIMTVKWAHQDGGNGKRKIEENVSSSKKQNVEKGSLIGPHQTENTDKSAQQPNSVNAGVNGNHTSEEESHQYLQSMLSNYYSSWQHYFHQGVMPVNQQCLQQHHTNDQSQNSYSFQNYDPSAPTNEAYSNMNPTEGDWFVCVDGRERKVSTLGNYESAISQSEDCALESSKKLQSILQKIENGLQKQGPTIDAT